MIDKQKLKKGSIIHVWVDSGAKKLHVEHVFKDMSGDAMVLFRWYGKHKQWWHYQVELLDKLVRWNEQCEAYK